MELEHGGRRYPLTGGELVLGSDPTVGLVLGELRPRHALVKALGSRMATIRPLEAGADLAVNGVAVGREPMPLLDGDRVRVGPHELRVRNPDYPAHGPNAPPPGAREQLHDTLFGLRKTAPTPDGSSAVPPARPEPPPGPGRPTGIVIAAAASLLALLFLLALLVL